MIKYGWTRSNKLSSMTFSSLKLSLVKFGLVAPDNNKDWFVFVGFGWGLDLVEVCICLGFGFSWGLDLVEDWIWLRFGFGWSLNLIEIWIWLRFGYGWGLELDVLIWLVFKTQFLPTQHAHSCVVSNKYTGYILSILAPKTLGQFSGGEMYYGVYYR